MSGEPFRELEVVYIDADRPAAGLRRGAAGTIIHAVRNAEPAAYLLEFVDETGQTYGEDVFTAEEMNRVPPVPADLPAK